MPKWKMQSEMFRQAMRAANGSGSSNNVGGGYGGKSGGGYQPPAEEYDDRTPCPYCGRKFNENAAKRHITHCEQQSKKAAMKGGPPRGGRR